MKDKKIKGRHNWKIYFYACITGLAVVSIILFGFGKGIEMTAKYSPLVDAAMEIKLETTIAHLWLEEFLTGDRNTEVGDVIKHIDQADWYAKAMLEGGKNSKGIYFPLDDNDMRREIRIVRKKLTEIRKITDKKYHSEMSTIAGVNIDQYYHDIFEDFINHADNVETKLNQIIKGDLGTYQNSKITLVIIITILTLVIGFVINTYDRQMNINITQKQEVNEILEKEIGERKLIEERLHLLSQAVEQSSALVIITDTTGTIEYVNTKFEQVTGYSKEEAIGQNPRILKSNYMTDSDYRDLWKNISSGKEWNGELQNKKKNGELYWELASISAVKDSNGNIKHYMAIKEDITERKAIENAFKESEKKFKDMAELLPETIYECDTQGNLTFVNQVAFKKFGYSQEDFDKGLNAIKMLIPDDQEKSQQNMKKILNREKIGVSEYTAQRKNGSTFPILIYSSPIMKENNTIGLRGLIIDISERKEAENELLMSEFLLQESQKIAHLGSYFLDLVSEKWKGSYVIDQLFGIDEDYQKNVQDWLGLVHPEDRAMMQDYFATNVLTNHEFFNKEYRIKRINDQKVRWVHGLGKLEFDINGNPINMIGTIQDITERKKTEENLKESERRFKTLSEATIEGIAFIENGKIFDVNQQLADMLGYDIKELFDMKVDEFILPKDLNLVKDKIMSGSEEPYELHLVRKDGTIITTELHPRTIYYEGRQVRMTSVHDITEHKIAEEKLIESEERFKRLFYDLGDAVFVAKVGGAEMGQIIEVNPAAEKQTGYSYKELIGMNIGKDIAVHGSGEINQNQWDKLLREGKLVKSTEKKKRKDGREYWVEVLVTPIDFRGIKACISINRDINKRKKAEEELNMYKLHLEKLVKERTNELERTNKQLQSEIEKQQEVEKAVKTAFLKEKELNELKTLFF